jgi:hypothetical protein
MELTEELFNRIHAYLRGESSAEERAILEEQMRKDPTLASEVAAQRRIKAGLKANHYKRTFADIHTRLKAEGGLQLEAQPEGATGSGEARPVARLWPVWKYVAVAASLLLVAGFGWFIVTSQNRPVTNQLAGQPAGPEATGETLPGPVPAAAERARPAGPLPGRAERAPDYAALFAESFDPAPELSSPFSAERLGVSPGLVARWQTDTAALMAGIRYLENRQAKEALASLGEAGKSSFSAIREQAQWYGALVELQQGRANEARQQLLAIAAQAEHPYQDRAARLTDELTTGKK